MTYDYENVHGIVIPPTKRVKNQSSPPSPEGLDEQVYFVARR